MRLSNSQTRSKTEHEELEALQPRFRKGVEWDAALLIIDDLLESRGLTRSHVTVEHIHIRLNFMGDGLRNGTSLTIKMSPRASDLKRIDDEELQAIADRCFRRWGIIDV
jgi:hypothetical protein